MSLEIVFSDKTRQNGREFVVLRELRGQATLPRALPLQAAKAPGSLSRPSLVLNFH
jgi:hypothetical protein